LKDRGGDLRRYLKEQHDTCLDEQHGHVPPNKQGREKRQWTSKTTAARVGHFGVLYKMRIDGKDIEHAPSPPGWFALVAARKTRAKTLKTSTATTVHVLDQNGIFFPHLFFDTFGTFTPFQQMSERGHFKAFHRFVGFSDHTGDAKVGCFGAFGDVGRETTGTSSSLGTGCRGSGGQGSVVVVVVVRHRGNIAVRFQGLGQL
jgi:hypothetical protein